MCLLAPEHLRLILRAQLEKLNDNDSMRLPVLPPPPKGQVAPDRTSVQRYMRLVIIALSNPPREIEGSANLVKAQQELEKFLLEKPLKLERDVRKDMIKQAEEEDIQAERERKLWIQSGKRSRQLRSVWNEWRDELIHGDELDKTFTMLKRYTQYTDLPDFYQDAGKILPFCSLYLY